MPSNDPFMKAKPKTPEYTNFENALREVLKVSHSDMKARIEAAKQERKERRKRLSASGRASRAKD
jgi:hypothetical protein